MMLSTSSSVLLFPLCMVVILILLTMTITVSSSKAYVFHPSEFYYYTRIHSNRRQRQTGMSDNNQNRGRFKTPIPVTPPHIFYTYSNKSVSYLILVGDDKEKLQAKLNKSDKIIGSDLDRYYENHINEKKEDNPEIPSIRKPVGSLSYDYDTGRYEHNKGSDNSKYDIDEITKEQNQATETAKAGHRQKENESAMTTTTTEPSGEGDGPWINDLTWDDATWILTASFIIFTMQTGFGMLESGCVSIRNESNIMMKNVVDVVFGGLTYWIFGFSISFGTDAGSTPYYGVGEYLVDSDNNLMGPVFAAFMFQLSFATTATTIVSGTMAERCNFKAYCVFSLLNTVVYCVPARWVWGPTGFLGELGAIDIAGSGAVHLLGGVSGFTAAWLLGPRLGRYENGTAALPLGNPTSCIVGLYILWWGWLAFNSGSTFGVSGAKWKFAARAATTTLISSIGGGLVGSVWTLIKPGRVFEVMDIVNPVLGALVGVTAGCALFHTVDAFVVGIVGGIVVIMTSWIPDALRVDDPVGATAVHGFGGLWGLIAVAIFAENDQGLGFTKDHAGLLRGGDFFLLKAQLIAALCIIVWSFFISFSLLWVINKFVPIRMEPHEELLGADFVEHLVLRREFELSNALAALGSVPEVQEVREKAQYVGTCNPVHATINVKIKGLGKATRWQKLKAKTVVASAFMKILQETQSRRASVTDEKREQLSTIIVRPQSSSYDVVKDYLGNPFSISTQVPYQSYNNYVSINNHMHYLNKMTETKSEKYKNDSMP